MVTGDNIYQTYQRDIQEKLGNTKATETVQQDASIFYILAEA